MKSMTKTDAQKFLTDLTGKRTAQEFTAEDLLEESMRATVEVAERAHALGAPPRVFEAGGVAVAAYAARAGMYRMLGVEKTPEHILREVVGDLQRRQLLEDTASHASGETATLEAVSEPEPEIYSSETAPASYAAALVEAVPGASPSTGSGSSAASPDVRRLAASLTGKLVELRDMLKAG